jgi:hypothetical protein
MVGFFTGRFSVFPILVGFVIFADLLRPPDIFEFVSDVKCPHCDHVTFFCFNVTEKKATPPFC